MHSETKAERKRIFDIVADFCWAHETNDYMLGKGCAECPIRDCNICSDDGVTHIVPMARLKEAEKIILEVLKENEADERNNSGVSSQDIIHT